LCAKGENYAQAAQAPQNTNANIITFINTSAVVFLCVVFVFVFISV